eukprot:RCo007587
MRLLLSTVVVVAAFCAVTAQTDCLLVSFNGLDYIRITTDYPHDLPLYVSLKGAFFLYYNTNLTVGTGADKRGWACNTDFTDTWNVFELSITSANRPWLSPSWTTGIANPQGAGITVPAPVCK